MVQIELRAKWSAAISLAGSRPFQQEEGADAICGTM